MSNAPERIWAWTWNLLGYGKQHGVREWVPFSPKPFSVNRFVPTGVRWWEVLKGEDQEITQVVNEYIRADLADAAVAAALEGAIENLMSSRDVALDELMGMFSAVDRLRSLITAPARAALDAMLAEARADERRKVETEHQAQFADMVDRAILALKGTKP